MTGKPNFIDKLRVAGLRPTKQRVKICEILFNREKTFHFTVPTPTALPLPGVPIQPK